MERLLTPEELAEVLQVPLATLRRWREQRNGPPAHKVGKHLRFAASDVEAWLANRRDAERVAARSRRRGGASA